MKKWNRYETMQFELNTEEKEKAGLKIISARQKVIEGLEDEVKNIENIMRKKCPDLAEKLTLAEKKLKVQRKFLKDSISGLKRKPFTIYADVIVQPSSKLGYLEFVENSGTETVMLEEPGLENQIMYPEDPDYTDE